MLSVNCIPVRPASSLAARLEEFIGRVQERPEKAVSFEEGSLQKWCATGVVDFLELFCGKGVLTLVVSETGLRTGEGIDGRWTSYGCIWDLKKASTQMRLAWLVAYGIQPLAIHSGTPCTEFTVIASRDPRRY